MAKKKVTKKKAPQKECPKCGTHMHVRTAQCKCGHKFGTIAKKKAIPKKKQPASKTGSLADALKAEREVLQRKIDAIDQLLED